MATGPKRGTAREENNAAVRRLVAACAACDRAGDEVAGLRAALARAEGELARAAAPVLVGPERVARRVRAEAAAVTAAGGLSRFPGRA